MQTSLLIKKSCFICNKTSDCSIESRVINGNLKCDVFRCRKCGLQFLDKKFVQKNISNNFYKESYKHVYDKNFFMNPNNIYKKIFDQTKKYFKKKDVLEIGPGGGYFFYYLKNVVNIYNAVEVGNTQRSVLQKLHKIKVFSSLRNVKKKYDVIVLISVLEHVKQPIIFLTKLKKFLKKNGLIIFEVPNVDDPLISHYNLDYYKQKYYRKVHLNYFNNSTIKKLIKIANLKLVYQKTLLTYSLSNHLSWFYKKRGNKKSSDATNIYFEHLKDKNKKIINLFSYLDEKYKEYFHKKKIGDIEICVCK